MPIRRWEIWNEPNIVTFAEPTRRAFAQLIRTRGASCVVPTRLRR